MELRRGGLSRGRVYLLEGSPGTGKTTMALQMARNIASGGQANVLYICFEHDEQYLLNRMIAMESALAHLPHKTGAIKIQDVRKEILGTWMAEGAASPQLANNPRLQAIMHPGLDLTLVNTAEKIKKTLTPNDRSAHTERIQPS